MHTIRTTLIASSVFMLALLLDGCAAPAGGAPSGGAPSGVAPIDIASSRAAAAPVCGQSSPPSPIVAPTIDGRTYRAVTLANCLRVVIISDPQADKSAASLVVHRGSFDEPAQKPGLAHFLEHMLFLGTSKYPNPDEYAAFINSHGGSHNAYTAGDHTNFFFEIAPDQFATALDRFAQFFIAPTFDKTYVEKEMKAVNSEYQMQIKQDEWRGNAVQKLAMNPVHPASRFSIGSLETLQDKAGASTRDALIGFFNEAYAPTNMTLAVYGREDLDTLEGIVRERFGAVPQRSGLRRATPPPAFAPGSLPRWIDVQPVREERIVEFNFPLRGQDALYHEKPAEYLANLIGHEGVGSLHSALKARGWIESLAAGAGRLDSANAEFTVAMQLTAAGAQHVSEIGAALFSYIALLRQEGILERLFQEQATIARLSFDYQEQSKAINYVTGIAVNMDLVPVGDVLRAPAAFDRFDAGLIRETLNALNVDNVLVTYISPDIKPSATEKWFNVPYRMGAIPVNMLAAWRAPVALSGIALPAPNPFLPEHLALVEGSAAPSTRQIPTTLATHAAESAGLRLWHLADTEFRAPRANVVVRIATPLVRASAADAAYAALHIQLVRDALAAYSYPAYLAGLSYEIQQNDKGILLMMGGFSDKEPVLLETVLRAFTSTSVDANKFAIYRAQLIREWENTHQGRPYEQAMAEMPLALLKPRWSPDELRAAAGHASVAGLQAWRKKAFAKVSVDVLAHGNVDPTQAAHLAAIVSKQLHVCATCKVTEPSMRKVTTPLVRTLKINHEDASLVLYAQGDSRAFSERARYGLLAHLLREPYFNTLRTEQSLGYVVSVQTAVMQRVPGIAFVVQSNAAGPERISNATFAFLESWRGKLVSMDDADYGAQRAGLVSRLLEKDRNLIARTTRLWSDLDDGITTFDSRQQIAAQVGALNKADFLAFYDGFLQSVQQRRLMVLSAGKFGPVPTTLGAESKPREWQTFN